MTAVPSRSDVRVSGSRMATGILIFVVLFLIALVGARRLLDRPPLPMPILGSLPELMLLSSENVETPLSSLRGKILIVDLHPSECEMPCAVRSAHMEQIQYWNSELADRVVLVTVKEGPTSLEILKAQMEKNHAGPAWKWFTASQEDYLTLKQALQPKENAADLAILDWDGNVRRRYALIFKEHRQELLMDTRALILEHQRVLGGTQAEP